jgi:SecD/SecF fusion protein
MSVDANVIIYERIKEELRAGKGLKLAIRDGYNAAYSAILYANITTLLTGIILFTFGHGPIQGFATTLIIGILTSLFSAIFITRLIFEARLNKNKPITFYNKWTKDFMQNVNIDFLGKRKIFYIVSGILVGISIISLAINGLDLGVDFVGGRTYIIRFPGQNKVNTVEVAKLVRKELKTLPVVKTFGADNQIKLVTKYKINSKDPKVENEVDSLIYVALKPMLPDTVSMQTFEQQYIQTKRKVGPTIAHDIKKAAVNSVIFALLVIFLYIFIRFRNWQYGLGATVALMHDSLIVMGVFSLFYKWNIFPFSLEIDQSFIAAILTVVGYSVNDTVIVFDRIREYLREHPHRERYLNVNLALNSTLSRTINTSLTTFFVLLVIFLFGGEVIRGFIFAMLIGIVVGTYSSLFVATPLAYDTIRGKEKRVKSKKEEEDRKRR